MRVWSAAPNQLNHKTLLNGIIDYFKGKSQKELASQGDEHSLPDSNG